MTFSSLRLFRVPADGLVVVILGQLTVGARLVPESGTGCRELFENVRFYAVIHVRKRTPCCATI